MSFRAYLLDIEGTTTPIDFVTRTLFPFARQRLDDFAPTPEEYDLLSAEWESDEKDGKTPPLLGPDYLRWLMDQDRKSTGLKSLQGRIWEQGYENGDLMGEMYDDVVSAILKWVQNDAQIAIFSSGSVLAQKLIFGYSRFGDLSQHISHYFDTTTGPKRDASSYQIIANVMQITPHEICFLSDIAEEVSAARGAGMTSCLVARGAEQINEFPDRISSFEYVIS